jgi:hypothetical protein
MGVNSYAMADLERTMKICGRWHWRHRERGYALVTVLSEMV